jgi:hypothetical protein
MAERKISPYLNHHKIYRKVNIINPYILGGGIDSDAAAYFARMSTQPPAGLKALLTTEIIAMKAAGIWGELDQFVFMNLHTAQASKLDVKNYKNHVWSGSPSWTQKIGVTTAGDYSNYVNTKIVLTNCSHYKLNDAGIYANQTVDGSLIDGTYDYVSNISGPAFGSYYGYNRLNSIAKCYCYWVSGTIFLVRTNSSTLISRISGVETSMEVSSGAIPITYEYYLGGLNCQGNIDYVGSNTYKQYGFGSSMNLTKRNALQTIMDDFNSKVGASY